MDDVDRENLLCHLYKLLCTEIPNCGCNDPGAAFKLVHDLVKLAPFYEDERWRQAERLVGSDGAFQIVIAALSDAELLEHGGSMGGSWLGPRGRWFLWAVEQAGGIDGLDDKLDLVGYPHDGGDCTEACWQIPVTAAAEPAVTLVPKTIDPVVFVPCPGASCVSYLYGVDHQHTARTQ